MKKLYGSLLMFMPFLAMAMEVSQNNTPIEVTQEMIDKFQELQAIPRGDVRLTEQPEYGRYGFSGTKGLLFMEFIENGGFGPEFAQKLLYLKDIYNKVTTLSYSPMLEKVNPNIYNSFQRGYNAPAKVGYHDILASAMRAFRTQQTPENIVALLTGIQESINTSYDLMKNEFREEFDEYLQAYSLLNENV